MLYEVKDEHEPYVERLLEALSDAESPVRSMSVVLLLEDGSCCVSYENAGISDMLIMQGQIGLVATRRYFELHYPSAINESTRVDEDSEDDN